MVIQGQVDKWRIERRNAHRLHESLVEKALSIFDFAPLPYDDELKDKQLIADSGLSDKEIYDLVTANW